MASTVFPVPSTSATKTLGLSVLSTNASITTLPTKKEITAVIIGGGGGSGSNGSSGATGSAGCAGGGSGYIKEYTFTLTSAVTASVTIGAGGAGALLGNGNAGGNGGSTTLVLPGVATVVASGGGGTFGGGGGVGPGGGSGGGGGGAGGVGTASQGGDGGNGGIIGAVGVISTVTAGYGSTTVGFSQDLSFASDTIQANLDSITNASTTLNLIGAKYINALPGATIEIRGNTSANSISWVPGSQVFNLTNNYTGTTTSGSNVFIPALINNPYSTIKDAIKLLNAASITLPGGGGGGGGSRTDSVNTPKTGGIGAGTGGAGGQGAVTGTPGTVLATAGPGTAGAQPGGGAGGCGSSGWANAAPGSGNSAAGGAGAVYFFWAAQEEL